MLRRRGLAAGGLAALLLLLLGVLAAWLYSGRAAGPAAALDPDSGPAVREARRTPVLPTPAPGEPAAPLPASLRGTDVAGGLVVDRDGRFRATEDALELFDYYLAASGEEPLVTLRARIQAAIDARLDGDAAAAARELLDRYLAYRESVRDLVAEGLDGWSLERRFQHLRELRRGFFTPAEVEGLFADEEGRQERDLERRRLVSDPALDPDERARLLATLEAASPAVEEAPRAAIRLRADEERLRGEGASDAEIRALREERFGPEAAERLALLDQRRASWSQRQAAWHEELSQLRAGGAGEEVIGRRRSERFSGPELLRAAANEPKAPAADEPEAPVPR